MELEKKDFIQQVYSGADYKIPEPKSVGEFKEWLKYISDDLPKDNSLEIADLSISEGKLCYILRNPIPID